jgi:hypothetical protein
MLEAFCKEEMYMTLEVEKANGKELELWSNKTGDYFWNSYSYMYRIELEGSFMTLIVDISDTDFERQWIEFGSDNDQEFSLSMSVSFYDGSETLLDSASFNLNVIGSGDNNCEEAYLEHKSTSRKLTMAFNNVEEDTMYT